MTEYRVTPAGEALALHTGLDDLAKQVKAADELPTAIAAALRPTTNPRYEYDYESDESIDVLRDDIVAAQKYLIDDRQKSMFEKALTVDPTKHNWCYEGETTKTNVLFEGYSLIRHAPATAEDQLVVSGLAGLGLKTMKHATPLLDETRYAEFGFRSYTETCAFIGAYVVGECTDASENTAPHFDVSDEYVGRSIYASATYHGDLAFYEKTVPLKNIVSPLGTKVEYCPTATTLVSAYHSLEPAAAAGLITAEATTNGKTAAQQLVTEFTDILAQKIDKNGQIPHTTGNFGDYGGTGRSDEVRYALSGLDYLVSERTNKNIANGVGETVLDSLVAPWLDARFQIVTTRSGVTLQNVDGNTEEVTSAITIARDQYPAMFQALLEQCIDGLGRTSPYQMAELLTRSRKLLDY